MYYQINAIMEKKKYEEKPSVVVVDKVVDQIYTTVNFGIREVEGGYEAYTATMTGHLTADEFVKRINGYGLNEEMTTQELETIFEALGFAGGMLTRLLLMTGRRLSIRSCSPVIVFGWTKQPVSDWSIQLA